MSAEDVSKFQAHVQRDPQLLQKLNALQGEADHEALKNKIAEIGRDHGYDISAGEVDGYLNTAVKGGELSDEALSSVAGGAGKVGGSWTYSWPGC